MERSDKNKAGWFKSAYAAATVGAATLLFGGCGNREKQAADNAKSDKTESLHKAVDYQVDTLPRWEDSTTGRAYWSQTRNAIVQNYFEDVPDEYNDYTQSRPVLAHEQKHRDNAGQGLMTYSMSPEQYYKTYMHEEISANIAALIELRQQYLDTENAEVFLSDSGDFDFYLRGILSKEIDPFSQDAKMFDKEMSLIVNGMRDEWMEYVYPYYHDRIMDGLEKFIADVSMYNVFPDEDNYQKSLKICYNIGGVDFTKYMDKDVECGNREILDSKLFGPHFPVRSNAQKKPLANYDQIPQYYQWSPEKRMSEVREGEVLDLSKNILKRPPEYSYANFALYNKRLGRN